MFRNKFYRIVIPILLFTILLITCLSLRWSSKSIKPIIKENNGDNLKTILLWNSFFSWPDYKFGFGSDPFIKHNCTVSSCFVTNNRSLVAIDKFDAIVFHGPQFYPEKYSDYPQKRTNEQIYIYYSLESPSIFGPIALHNKVFNLTATYRLDSDIHFPYFAFYDVDGNVVAPRWRPLWKSPRNNSEQYQTSMEIYKRKTKQVAWFVSRCDSPNHRENYVKEMKKHNITIDIYGKCGTLQCPRTNEKDCFSLLKKDYLFYLAFENSNCPDYVTEKLYNAFTNDVLPVVLNGADMKIFAPPHSYLDARDFTPSQLVERIKFLIKNPEEYVSYFWWKSYYHTRFDSPENPFCKMCEILHRKHIQSKTYDSLTDWLQGSDGNSLCSNNIPDYRAK